MVTIKELQLSVPDKILDVYTEGDVTVIVIPTGRVKILPKHKKLKLGYSLRNGGRRTKYTLPNNGIHYPDWLMHETRIEHELNIMNNRHGKVQERWRK